MTWAKLLDRRDVQRHTTSKRELENLRSLIERDLADSAVGALSADRRFATAYNAALQTVNMAIACAGYRVTSKTGHHRVSLECIRLALGEEAGTYADYFDTCRRKRNAIDYSHSHVATETEVKEMLKTAREFYKLVESWIVKNHPALR
jgi:hypothetical protein